jgi:hypothetical protein
LNSSKPVPKLGLELRVVNNSNERHICFRI